MTPAPRLYWGDAIRRGTALGAVTALHLFALAFLLQPARERTARVESPDRATAMQLSLIAEQKAPSALPASPAAPTRSRPSAAAIAFVTPRAQPVRAPAPPVPPRATDFALAVSPNSTDDTGYPSEDFHRALSNAQRPTTVRLPGSTTAIVQNITGRTPPSAQQFVRALTTASRCMYVAKKMRDSSTQFITRQLQERALQADGCGAQDVSVGTDAATEAMIEAISRRATSGR